MYIYIFLFYWKNSGFPLQWPFHNRISICFLPQTNPHVEGLSLRQFREFQNALGFEHDLRELRLGFATAKFSHSKCMVKLLMEEILHHLGCIKPWKYWDKLFINWCRISSINRINGFIHHGVLWLRETLWLQMRNCWFERMISPNWPYFVNSGMHPDESHMQYSNKKSTCTWMKLSNTIFHTPRFPL